MAIILNKKRKGTITRRRNNNNERLLLLDNHHHPPTVELGTLIIPFLRYNKTKRLVIKMPSKHTYHLLRKEVLMKIFAYITQSIAIIYLFMYT